MIGKNLKALLCALWLCGFFPADHPWNCHLSSSKKKRFTIRLLIVAWSIFLIIYPAVFHIDLWIHGRSSAPAENHRLSTLIPWCTNTGSWLVINAIVRLYTMLNYGKLKHLMETLRSLSLHCNVDATVRDTRLQWRQYKLIWFVYTVQVGWLTFESAWNLITNDYGSQWNGWRFVVTDLVFPIFINLPLSFLFHLLVALGTQLIQIHGSICLELAELLSQEASIVSVKTTTVAESRIEAENHVSRLQERFSSLKGCFRIYDNFSGTYVFCILWWILLVLITAFTSLSSEELRQAGFMSYAIWTLVFLYTVASFGDYMASSMDQGRDAISDTMGRLNVRSVLQNELVPNLVRLPYRKALDDFLPFRFVFIYYFVGTFFAMGVAMEMGHDSTKVFYSKLPNFACGNSLHIFESF